MNKSQFSKLLGLIIFTVIGYLLGGFAPKWLQLIKGKEDVNPVPEVAALPITAQDFGFGYWENGMRKYADNKQPGVLVLETGYYGLKLGMKDLSKPKFGLIKDGADYADALTAGDKRLEKLDDAELEVKIETGGKVYKAKTSAASVSNDKVGLKHAQMWESARYAQNYEIQGLEFKTDQGESLSSLSSLHVVSWPKSISLTADIEPAIPYKNGPEMGVIGQGHCVVDKGLEIPHQPSMEHERFTLETWIKVPQKFYQKGNSWLLCKNSHEGKDGNFGFKISRSMLIGMMNVGGRGGGIVLNTQRHELHADKWHHLALSYDGNTAKFYMDGKLKGSKVVGKKRNLGNAPMVLGQRGDSRGPVSPAVIDQVRIWNRSLSDQEIMRNARKPQEIKNREGLTYVNDFETQEKVRRPVWKDAKVAIKFKTNENEWKGQKVLPGKWEVGTRHSVSVHCDVIGEAEREAQKTKIAAKMVKNTLEPIKFDKHFGCYKLDIMNPKRNFRLYHGSSVKDQQNYDDIELTIESDKEGVVPFMIHLGKTASITGVCPILCYEDGTPTGIPVQLSKNWHYIKMGSYLRAYTLLPTIKGVQNYKLRLVYGYYGKVPAASHSQLSLVGYGGNGRWDQLAIGCWGETYCMDVDMSLVDVMVTDVRMLMSRNGKEGKKWDWTDAGWGGDWLSVKDAKGQKLVFKGIKTAYHAHGPCFTEVGYDGSYGKDREVDVAATVRTLRTNDYARTFTKLKYTFNQKMKSDGWLFKMGRTSNYATPKIAYGDKSGITKQHEVPNVVKDKTNFIPEFKMAGASPWWVAFPGAGPAAGKTKDWGTGYRAMVIRSYRVVSQGKEYSVPTIEFPAFRPTEGKSNIDFLLKAPAEVTEFNPGDTVEIDLAWVTLHREADDYYGGNEVYRSHLAKNPSSWKTIFREVTGNDLKVNVTGGELIENYPVIVKATAPEVKVDIEGGVGFVPLRFEGLKDGKGYSLYQVIDGVETQLDQSVHGNDYWQTDYDAKANRFHITFNLPLDGLDKSSWILKYEPKQTTVKSD